MARENARPKNHKQQMENTKNNENEPEKLHSTSDSKKERKKSPS
jgi:hypothetical protein